MAIKTIEDLHRFGIYAGDGGLYIEPEDDGEWVRFEEVRNLLGASETKVCECPPGNRTITQGGHFAACTACHRRLK